MIAGWRGKGKSVNHGGDLWNMAAVDDVVELIEQFHLAEGEFVKLNPAHGWEQVAAAIERAASQFRDGQFVCAEIVATILTKST
jgi:hypothetical protein